MAVAFLAACKPEAGLRRCGLHHFNSAGSSNLPRIELKAGERTGLFLIDYGATQSSLSSLGNGNGGDSGKEIDIAFNLPTFSHGRFQLRPVKDLGIVGTDFLSLLSADFSFAPHRSDVTFGDGACDPATLRADGMVPIDQAGFFASQLQRLGRDRPNIPVVFLSLGSLVVPAQIDTGYDDAVYSPSVDINDAVYQRLSSQGLALERLADVSVATCAGMETRPAYRMRDRVALATERGEQVRAFEGVTLILKRRGTCGGIAQMSEPAAQIGIGLLRQIGRVVFDPKAGRVWVASHSARP